MSERAPQAGRISGPITRHAPLDRPSVVVTVGGVEHAGREHARAMDGQAVLVHWGSDYRWVRAADVTTRGAKMSTTADEVKIGYRTQSGADGTAYVVIGSDGRARGVDKHTDADVVLEWSGDGWHEAASTEDVASPAATDSETD